MSTVGTARNACAGSGAFLHQRHRPEKSLLYQLVPKLYSVFRQQLAEEGRILPAYVQREFEDYLKCGRLEHGFLRVRCQTCHEERLVAFSCKRRAVSAPVAVRAAWPTTAWMQEVGRSRSQSREFSLAGRWGIPTSTGSPISARDGA